MSELQPSKQLPTSSTPARPLDDPMRKFSLIKAAVLSAVVPMNVSAALYWDLNTTDPGAGTTPTGTWDGATLNWNTDSAGVAAPGVWAAGETAVFSAGSDATGTYTVTLSSPQTAGGLSFEEGSPTVTGSTLTLNSGSIIDVAPSRTVTISS